jgi:hypothetical protein
MIKLYSSGCTRCGIIENILNTKNIQYKLITDENTYLKLAKENNISVMPFAEIDGKIYNSMELQQWLNNKR